MLPALSRKYLCRSAKEKDDIRIKDCSLYFSCFLFFLSCSSDLWFRVVKKLLIFDFKSPNCHWNLHNYKWWLLSCNITGFVLSLCYLRLKTYENQLVRCDGCSRVLPHLQVLFKLKILFSTTVHNLKPILVLYFNA